MPQNLLWSSPVSMISLADWELYDEGTFGAMLRSIARTSSAETPASSILSSSMYAECRAAIAS